MNTIARRPTKATELVRIADRISFVYLEHCIINRYSNALTVTDKQGVAHIPAASGGVLLLGPGTTVTQQAMLLLSDSGSTAVWAGERAVRYYAHGSPLSRSSRLAVAQAVAVTNTRTRLRVARTMYQMRFKVFDSDWNPQDFDGVTLMRRPLQQGSTHAEDHS